MDTLYLEDAQLTHLVTHRVGNLAHEEGYGLSSKGSRVKQEAFEPFMSYLLSPFKPEEFFQFGHPESLDQNLVFDWIKKVFQNEVNPLDASKELAQVLYQASNHPKIRGGQFHFVKMKGVVLNGEELEAIGLFKSESKVPFIKIEPGEECYDILSEEGLELKGLDKGALIFKVDEEKGYRILVHNAQRNSEARYWNDHFLQLVDCQDDYHLTKDMMHITKEYVTKKLDQEFEVDRTEQIDLLNRTAAYFKESESFDREEFAEKVLQQEEVIESFGTFEDQFRTEHSLEKVDQFDLSEKAVKKQARVFKSVLKLDKNFHVYIHGDKDLIERGQEADGRKFYKIYFDQEA